MYLFYDKHKWTTWPRSIPKLETIYMPIFQIEGEEAWGFIPPSPKSPHPSIQQKGAFQKVVTSNPLGKKWSNSTSTKNPSFMCLINLRDILDHGKMVGIVCMEDGGHCYLSGFLIDILWSFAKGIAARLVADFKPWGVGSKVWLDGNLPTNFLPDRKKKGIFRHSLKSTLSWRREFWRSIHFCCLFLPLCVFFWGWFFSRRSRWNSTLVYQWGHCFQQFPGCPEQFGAVHVLQGWLVIVCDGQLMSRFHQKWVGPEGVGFFFTLPPK